MTLQSILNNLPLNDYVTVSVWDHDEETELVRETKLMSKWNGIGIFSEKVLAHRLAPVRFIYSMNSEIIIECRERK